MNAFESNTTSIQALNNLIPENQQQRKTIKARTTLGEIANQYTDEQLESLVADFEYLAETWLDDFEKLTYGGKTLQELLKSP